MNISRVSQFTLVAVLVLASQLQLLAQSKCQPPSIPPSATNLFTPQQEMELGDAVAAHIESSFRVIDDEEVTGYLRRIGERLIAQIPSTQLHFQFYVVDINDVNAFTLPGGRIYVTRKLIAFAKNEDEIAGVVAHELGHVIARHNANDMSVLFREILGVTQLGDRRDIFEKYHLFIENRKRKPKAEDKLGSREDRDQYAADMVGLYVMAGAGYDAQAQAGFWDRYQETKGKTGSFFSSLFGTTKPEQKRLAEMLRQLSLLPADCRGASRLETHAEFAKWQTTVVKYTGLGRRESLRGVSKKTKLDPPLRSSVYHMRFSPDGKYLLAQDDAGISVLTRAPLASLFRIHAPDAFAAQFSPDSREIVLYTPNLRVETWNIATQALTSANEVVLRNSCMQTALSPDGKTLACLNDDTNLLLIEVSDSSLIFEKKSFTVPSFFESLMRVYSIFSSVGAIADEGHFVNMAFSPDSHYFMAGDISYGWTSLGGYSAEKALAFDLQEKKPLEIKGDLKQLAMGGFAFVGSAKVIGNHYSDAKKSGLYSFPEGDAIERFSVPRTSWKSTTQGNYVLVSGAGQLHGAVFRLTDKKYFRPGVQPLLDVFENTGAAETPNGEIALHDLDSGLVKTLAIPENPLGRLYAVALSPDLSSLALSGSVRGALWNLDQGKMVVYVRGFKGAGFADDGSFYLDFPAKDQALRTIAHVDPTKGEILRGPDVKASGASQYGSVLVRARPKIQIKDGREFMDWSKGASELEVFDARTMEVLWSQHFAQEFPSFNPDGVFGTMVLGWAASSKAAIAEIQNDPNLSKRFHKSNDSDNDYLFKVIDLKTGKALGQLVVETGGRAFRIVDAVDSGDFFVAMDNQNRALVYSLASGALRGRVFGNRATLSPTANLLCVENESGQLTFYDLNSFEKRGQLNFAERLRTVRFSADGKRLAVLTAGQTVYTFDVATLAAQ